MPCIIHGKWPYSFATFVANEKKLLDIAGLVAKTGNAIMFIDFTGRSSVVMKYYCTVLFRVFRDFHSD